MTDRHAGPGENDLEESLPSLAEGDRVFITYEDYKNWHSPDGEGLDEFNYAGAHGRVLRELADAYGCDLLNDPDEQRVYFFKKIANP